MTFANKTKSCPIATWEDRDLQRLTHERHHSSVALCCRPTYQREQSPPYLLINCLSADNWCCWMSSHFVNCTHNCCLLFVEHEPSDASYPSASTIWSVYCSAETHDADDVFWSITNPFLFFFLVWKKQWHNTRTTATAVLNNPSIGLATISTNYRPNARWGPLVHTVVEFIFSLCYFIVNDQNVRH